MHLKDSELLEPTPENKRHLDACKHCLARLKVLGEMRNSLKSMDNLTMPEKDWVTVWSSADDRVNLHPEKRQKTRFWQGVGLGLAASLVLALSIALFNIQIDDSGNIASLIKENNALQAQLAVTKGNESQSARYFLFNSRMEELDLSIQRAYLNDQSPEIKMQLWNARKKLLKRWIEDNCKTNLMSI